MLLAHPSRMRRPPRPEEDVTRLTTARPGPHRHPRATSAPDGKRVGGLAVEIGREIGERAGPGEVVVSHTVKDLMAGSGLRFKSLGAAAFESVAGRWQPYQVVRRA